MADAATLPARGMLDAIPGLRSLALLVGVAAAVAAALWLVLWSQGPNYTMLYGQLQQRDAGAVVDALTALNVPYKLDPATGGVLVPADRVYEARLQLATQGLPQGDGLGAEMLQQQQGFGSSQFMEGARYQLALETELARTITRVQGVQSARVHLALPKQSVFIRDRRHPSASVMLQLFQGRRLETGQVAAIVHLVASSVPELEAGQVTVVDQNGSLLSSPDSGDDLAATGHQIEYQRAMETSYERRIEALLTPLVGAGRVRAGVTAEVDFTQTERTTEDYDPAQQVVRSEQTAVDQRMAGDLALGIPGALSNEPPQTTPAPPAAQQQAPAAARQPGAAAAAPAEPQPVATQNRATRNYEIDRTISHTRQPVGNIRRLSVAVILDDKRVTGADGTSASQAYSQPELARFESIVREAVGFDEARGDRVQVVSQSFSTLPAEAAVEAAPLWENPKLQAVARQAIGIVLVLLVALLVLRPLMKSLTHAAAAPAHGRGGGNLPELAGDRVSLSVPGGMQVLPANYDQQVAAARSLVGQDPRRAAEIVKEWVAADGR